MRTEIPTTLDQLAAALRDGTISDRDYDEWTSLPTFGGEEPADTRGVWSWDATRLLVGEDERLYIVTREEWAEETT